MRFHGINRKERFHPDEIKKEIPLGWQDRLIGMGCENVNVKDRSPPTLVCRA